MWRASPCFLFCSESSPKPRGPGALSVAGPPRPAAARRWYRIRFDGHRDASRRQGLGAPRPSPKPSAANPPVPSSHQNQYRTNPSDGKRWSQPNVRLTPCREGRRPMAGRCSSQWLDPSKSLKARHLPQRLAWSLRQWPSGEIVLPSSPIHQHLSICTYPSAPLVGAGGFHGFNEKSIVSRLARCRLTSAVRACRPIGSGVPPLEKPYSDGMARGRSPIWVVSHPGRLPLR